MGFFILNFLGIVFKGGNKFWRLLSWMLADVLIILIITIDGLYIPRIFLMYTLEFFIVFNFFCSADGVSFSICTTCQSISCFNFPMFFLNYSDVLNGDDDSYSFELFHKHGNFTLGCRYKICFHFDSYIITN